MEDLFNFSNADNLLGDDPNLSSTVTSSILNPPRDHRTQSSPRNYAPTVNNNTEIAAAEQKEKTKKKKTYKIAIIGDPQTGKTTFLTKHLNGSFNSSYHATIGASTFNLQFNTNLDSHIFEVYDVAGQNLFVGKRDRYYKDIRGAIIMYDVMNWGSFENITDIWLKELKEKAPDGIPIVVVGNKMENRDTRKVSVEVVAEAISNTFDSEGIGYCEISVKTNQNLAEPFLFLTKRILNINDSKALYFVSKISELNLIESMLAQKKDKDKELEAKQPNDKDRAPSKDLGNLFLNETLMETKDKSNRKKGGDYLDDIIFKIGDDNTERKEKETAESKTNTQKNDDKFLADMMGMSSSTVSKTPKITSINAKKPSNVQQRNRSTSNVVLSNTKRPKSVPTKVKPKVQQKRIPSSTDNQGVLIDLLLGLQESLNHVQSDIRRLQGDVSYLKQEFQKRNKSHRK